MRLLGTGVISRGPELILGDREGTLDVRMEQIHQSFMWKWTLLRWFSWSDKILPLDKPNKVLISGREQPYTALLDFCDTPTQYKMRFNLNNVSLWLIMFCRTWYYLEKETFFYLKSALFQNEFMSHSIAPTFRSHCCSLCTKRNWEILYQVPQQWFQMSKYLTIVCARTREHTHKPSVDHEIAFTCLTILIYLTWRELINHS